MGGVKRWKPSELLRVRELAATPGQYASTIAAEFDVSLLSMLTICGRHAIPVIRFTPDEEAYRGQLAKAREKRKYDKWRGKQPPAHIQRIKVHLGTSRTHPIYRNQLPKLADDTSKEALRRIITEAVRNTAEIAHEA